VTITNSTLSGNAAAKGGGIWQQGGVLTLTSDTLSGNSASYGGAGAEPGVGGGIYVNATHTTLKNVILANTANGGNCYVLPSFALPPVSQGHNLSDDATCSSFVQAGDLNDTPAGLDLNGLQDNGGPTKTIALLVSSPAIDAIPLCECSGGTDQRGVTRPQGTTCDIGAFELQQATTADTTPPAITCPDNVLVAGNIFGSRSATVDPGMATATDESGPPQVVGVRSDGLALNAPYPLGTTIIAWEATDGACNMTTCLQTVTVVNTSPGTNVTIQSGDTAITFDSVSTAGITAATPIDPSTVGDVPSGFAVSELAAYQITTTATFTGSITIAFVVPGPISEADFNSLGILHNDNGVLVDVTATSPLRDYATLTIYATTTSLSPFYLVRKNPHVATLFDNNKAYKIGSTVPIKLRLLNASNANVSSSNVILTARDLKLVGGTSSAPVIDSGNSNPDNNFRYDPTLGGAGGGYIFNLSTKGLTAGRYILSFYGGNNHFFYTVKLEVK
jgi:hypothetical protein